MNCRFSSNFLSLPLAFPTDVWVRIALFNNSRRPHAITGLLHIVVGFRFAFRRRLWEELDVPQKPPIGLAYENIVDTSVVSSGPLLPWNVSDTPVSGVPKTEFTIESVI